MSILNSMFLKAALQIDTLNIDQLENLHKQIY